MEERVIAWSQRRRLRIVVTDVPGDYERVLGMVIEDAAGPRPRAGHVGDDQARLPFRSTAELGLVARTAETGDHLPSERRVALDDEHPGHERAPNRRHCQVRRRSSSGNCRAEADPTAVRPC
jgi:hypothetical protein